MQEHRCKYQEKCGPSHGSNEKSYGNVNSFQCLPVQAVNVVCLINSLSWKISVAPLWFEDAGVQPFVSIVDDNGIGHTVTWCHFARASAAQKSLADWDSTPSPKTTAGLRWRREGHHVFPLATAARSAKHRNSKLDSSTHILNKFFGNGYSSARAPIPRAGMGGKVTVSSGVSAWKVARTSAASPSGESQRATVPHGLRTTI